jgi:hypothetical protein
MNTDLTSLTNGIIKSNLKQLLAYSYFSDRINAIGTRVKGDLIDKAFGSLDFVVKSKLTEKTRIRLSCKKLTKPKY